MGTVPISDQLVTEVNVLLNKGWSHSKIAKKLGCSTGTVSNIKNKIALGESEVNQKKTLSAKVVLETRCARLKQDTHEVTRKFNEAVKQIHTLQADLETYGKFADISKMVTPMGVEIRPHAPDHDATPILVCSDWHIDEVVDGAALNNVNEYNLDVAHERLEKLARYAVKLLGMLKRESNIDTLVIAALGDFMSAWIHEELIETNSLTPPETLLELLNIWTGLIDHILDSGYIKNILFIGCVGNHSRITKRIQYKNRAKKSYEWILYKLIMRHYATKGEKRISFQHPAGYFNWLTLYGKKIRFHHGDNLRYQGGIGGVHIPVRKALPQWNKSMAADLDVFGHWHTREWAETYVINGSVIGYSAFAENLKADYQKAGQVMFLQHATYGKTAQFPIILQS